MSITSRPFVDNYWILARGEITDMLNRIETIRMISPHVYTDLLIRLQLFVPVFAAPEPANGVELVRLALAQLTIAQTALSKIR